MLIPLHHRFQGALLGSTLAPTAPAWAAAQRAGVAHLSHGAPLPVLEHLDSAPAALIAVPLVLLNHEEPAACVAQLATTVTPWLRDPETGGDVQAWALALASSLRGEPASLAFLAALSPPWPTLGAILQRAIAQEHSSYQLLVALGRQLPASTRAIALALYLMARSPVPPPLPAAGVLESSLGLARPLAASLTGARYGPWSLPRCEPASETDETPALAAELLRLWAGQSLAVRRSSLLVVTAAGDLQARPPFRPLAQRDSPVAPPGHRAEGFLVE